MPLYANTGLKFDDNIGGYVIDDGLVFPVKSKLFDLNSSYSAVYAGRLGLEISTSLREVAPSMGRRRFDCTPEKAYWSRTNTSGDQATSITLKPDPFNGGYLLIEKYSNSTGQGLWTFGIREDSVCCGVNVFNSSIPKSWELTFSGVADVLREYRVKGRKVIGEQQPAIVDLSPAATQEDIVNAINSILATMRVHGLIAE